MPWDFAFPVSGIGSATPITIDFGAILPFTDVPAYNLPVYASQWPSPDITQDSVRGCELSFAAVSISGKLNSIELSRHNPHKTARAALPVG